MSEEQIVTPTLQRTSTRALPADFEQMFRSHHDLVYRAAYRITGNSEDAEDVLQTLFLRLLRRESLPDISENPKGYLHRAAVNIALDVIKLRKRSVPVEDSQLAERRSDPKAAEAEECIRLALAELSPKAAEIFVLKHIEGYDNEEIAKLVGTSRGTIAVLLFRARARVKKSIRMQRGRL